VPYTLGTSYRGREASLNTPPLLVLRPASRKSTKCKTYPIKSSPTSLKPLSSENPVGKTLASRKKSVGSRPLFGNQRKDKLRRAPPFSKQNRTPFFQAESVLQVEISVCESECGWCGASSISCTNCSWRGAARGLVSRSAGLDSEVT